jgi:hypothetical protein
LASFCELVHFAAFLVGARDTTIHLPPNAKQRAAEDNKPASARSACAYVIKAFGTNLAEAEATMRRLAWSLSPEKLNRTGFRLYERFRPEVPPGAQGRDAKGILPRQDRKRPQTEATGVADKGGSTASRPPADRRSPAQPARKAGLGGL